MTLTQQEHHDIPENYIEPHLSIPGDVCIFNYAEYGQHDLFIGQFIDSSKPALSSKIYNKNNLPF